MSYLCVCVCEGKNNAPMFMPDFRRAASIWTLLVLGPIVAMIELYEVVVRGVHYLCVAMEPGWVGRQQGRALTRMTHVLRKYLLLGLMACSRGLREAYHSSCDSDGAVEPSKKWVQEASAGEIFFSLWMGGWGDFVWMCWMVMYDVLTGDRLVEHGCRWCWCTWW